MLFKKKLINKHRILLLMTSKRTLKKTHKIRHKKIHTNKTHKKTHKKIHQKIHTNKTHKRIFKKTLKKIYKRILMQKIIS